jgi:hypothetical protein
MDIIRITALLSFVTCLAQAAEPTIITLSCDGKLTDAKVSDEKPINKMGIVVNLAERTVSFSGYVVGIEKVDAANISFGGQYRYSGVDISVHGDIDRVTGAASIMTYTTATASNYDLLCKPANRMF